MTQEQLRALRSKLQNLEAVRDVLGEDAYAQAKADLEAQIQHVTRIAGASVEGSVTVRNGDFVGRDQYNIVTDPDAPPVELLRAYYRSLANECRHLPLGIVDPKFTQPAGEGHVALHDVYVNLDVVAPLRDEAEDAKMWGLRLARGEGESRAPLLASLAEPQAARVVLLGDPGSGKTTFVNYLTYRLAAAAARDADDDAGGEADADLPEVFQTLLPVRLILREVASHLPPGKCGSADMLWAATRADVVRRLGEPAAETLMRYLQKERLLREGGLFLLDGLDEVPEAGRRRRCLLESVAQLIDCLPSGGRVMLTARPYAYADRAWQLPGLPILALAPFDEAQVEHFVSRWYQSVHPVMGWSPEEAEARGQRLVDALQARPRLGDLASRPLLLTLMATLHTSWGQLPQDRADLYEESVRLLLARWQRAREVQSTAGERERQPGLSAELGVPEATVRAALEQLAYTAHARQGQAAQRDDAEADIPAGDVLAVFSPRVPDNVNPQRVLTYLETRAGLLLGRRPDVYAFLHRSFQEYLAACYLANTERDFGARLRALVWEDVAWWREVFLLGVGKKRQGGLGDAVNVVNALLPEGLEDVDALTETHWQAAVLASTALLDLDLVPQADTQPHYRALVRRARRWLVRLVEGGHLTPRERLQAGDALGRLGDPRPGVAVVPLPPRSSVGGVSLPPHAGEGSGMGVSIPNILWVHIPAGPFVMGSAEDDAEAYDDEKPQHTVTLPEYYIARYPVTNAQFRPFVEGDGYANPTYWTEQGWAWRQGAEADLSVWDDYYDEDFVRRYRGWLAGRPVEKRDRPFWWGNPRWGAFTRPVVGVTWFEAVAYARWLEAQIKVKNFKLKVWQAEKISWLDNDQLTFRVRLPSEAEWEKAARGTDGRVYPWGDDWRDTCANVEATGLEQTNPVGVFPKGASPYGVLDMAGNVWEWTRSRWGERSVMQNDYGYPYNPEDGRERLEGVKVAILRGGAWAINQRSSRCAARFRDNPVSFDPNSGFRVVVSLVSCSDC